MFGDIPLFDDEPGEDAPLDDELEDDGALKKKKKRKAAELDFER